MKHTVHSKETAPEQSVPVLEKVEQAFGFIPNITAVLASSPLALSAYAAVNGLLEKNASFTPQEQQVAILSINRANGCTYCMAAHSAVAEKAGVDGKTIQALRDGRDPENAKYAAVAKFARLLVEERGWVSEDEQQAFLDAGYTPAHILDLVTIVALKTMSNYTNHLAETPLDEAFEARRWEK